MPEIWFVPCATCRELFSSRIACRPALSDSKAVAWSPVLIWSPEKTALPRATATPFTSVAPVGVICPIAARAVIAGWQTSAVEAQTTRALAKQCLAVPEILISCTPFEWFVSAPASKWTSSRYGYQVMPNQGPMLETRVCGSRAGLRSARMGCGALPTRRRDTTRRVLTQPERLSVR